MKCQHLAFHSFCEWYANRRIIEHFGVSCTGHTLVAVLVGMLACKTSGPVGDEIMAVATAGAYLTKMAGECDDALAA